MPGGAGMPLARRGGGRQVGKMKFLGVLAGLGAMAGGLTAQTSNLPPAATQPAKAPAKIVLPATPAKETPAKKEAPKAAAKAPAKKDEIGKIDGVEIARGGKFLGLQVVNGNFKLTFYDAKKKPTTPDAVRAALRWDAKYKVGDERVVLLPSGDGKSFTGAKAIRPPYNFKVFVTLIKDGADEAAAETLVVDFRQ